MISSYIKNLLSNNKRVILPEFGGFVVKRSASGDVISFNNFLKFNDDILVEAVMEGESISKEQSTKKINDFVNHLTNELENNGKFEFDNIGFLMKDKKGNIRFVTHNENSENDFTKETQQQTGFTPNKETIKSNETIKEQNKNNTNNYTTMSHNTTNNKKKETIIICSVVAAIICIAIAGWILKDKIFGKTEEPPVIVETVPEVVPQPKEYAMQPLQIDTIDGILVIADENIAIKGEEQYNVIIGSFSEINNAEILNTALLDYGIESEILDRYNGFQAVSYGKYSSVDIALRIAEEQIIQAPDVWILVK